MSADKNNVRLAVLIDADNIHSSNCDQLFVEVGKLGEPIVKRIYGDWAKHKDWKEKVQSLGLQAIQQFAHTKTKNAVDIALVVDAMDLIYTGYIDGICIVASDSDYTRLVIRVRESGKSVYGFGEAKTIESLKNVYTKFILLGNQQSVNNVSDKPALPDTFKNNKVVINEIKLAINDCQSTDGWVFLSGLISKLKQDKLKSINEEYGYKHLSKFLKVFDVFELNETNQKVRLKKSQNE